MGAEQSAAAGESVGARGEEGVESARRQEPAAANDETVAFERKQAEDAFISEQALLQALVHQDPSRNDAGATLQVQPECVNDASPGGGGNAVLEAEDGMSAGNREATDRGTWNQKGKKVKIGSEGKSKAGQPSTGKGKKEAPTTPAAGRAEMEEYEEPDWSGRGRPDAAPWPFTILFVGVDNGDKTDPDLNLKAEFKAIEQAYRESQAYHADTKRVVIKQLLFSQWSEVVEEISKERPTVLHVGCHAHERGGLELFRQTVKPSQILPEIKSWNEDARSRIPPRPEIRLIVLNACESDEHARVFTESVDFAIGHRDPVKDSDAIQFSRLLYERLFDSSTLLDSFNIARASCKGYRLCARKDPRQFRLVHRDEGYYMYVAVQRPPVLGDSDVSTLQLNELIDDFAEDLQQTKDESLLDDAYPICVNGGNTSEVKAALDSDKVHTLIWCGNGRGWEAQPSGEERVGLEDLPRDKLPKVIVLMLKYGARQAAEWFFKKVGKGTVVLGLQADVYGSHGSMWLCLIKETIMGLHKDTSDLHHLVDKLRKEAVDVPNVYGQAYGDLKDVFLQWNPKSTAEPVVKHVANHLPPECTNIRNLCGYLRRQKLLSCDFHKVEGLKQRLNHDVHRMYWIEATDNEYNKRPEDITRCMSFALSVCRSFVLSPGKFKLVYIIEKDDDLQYVKNIKENRRHEHILLWAHLQDQVSAAEPGMDSSWNQRMSIELAGICKKNRNAHLILTTDKEWGKQECIDDIVKCGRQDSIQDQITQQFNMNKIETDEYCYPFELEPITDYTSKPEACADHEEIKIASRLRRAGGTSEACDLLDLFSANPNTLLQALQDTLPQQRPIAAMYRDEYEFRGDTVIALVVRISISDVKFLHELRDVVLRDVVLDRSFTHELSRRLLEGARESDRSIEELNLQVDLSHFAEMYEKEVLRLDSLTPHQKDKLQELREVHETVGNMHLEAPAGAGKTIVSLHVMREMLGQQDKDNRWQPRDDGEYILFVARNTGLAHFVVRWLWQRFSPKNRNEARARALKRLHVLIEKGDTYVGPQRCVERDKRITFEELPKSKQFKYKLLVVDEAHHVYGDPMKGATVERNVTPDVTQRFLLSDISQSVDSIQWPKTKNEEIERTQLTEVVRCSQRIVVAAGAFQLGENKLQTKSCHEAPGPPLKSYIFEPPGHSDEEYKFALAGLYVERAIKALRDVMTDFPNLSLDNRLALIVKDREMVKRLRPLLDQALSLQFPMRPLKLVDAETASSCVERMAHADEEWLVLDEMANFDGLERLIVLCIGLDSEIEDPNSNVRETRSLLYRALTRAHMIAAVINEKIPGGFLEFLTGCRLEKTEKFDQEEEKKQINYGAVDQAISFALEKIIETKHLDKDAVAAIKAQVADQIGAGKFSIDDEKAVQKAISAASDEWARDQKKIMLEFQKRATTLGFTFAPDEDQLRDKACARAVTMWRADSRRAKTDAEKNETVTEAVLKSLQQLVPNRLISYAKNNVKDGRVLLPEEADAVSKRRISTKLRAEPPVQLQQACKEALCEWNEILKETKESTSKIAKEFEPADWPVDRFVVERLPALAALEVMQQGRQAQEVMEVLRSVLKAAQTEKQMLKEGDLLKLSREVAKTVSMKAASELPDSQKSPDAIAKVLTGEFLVPALIAQTEEARKLSNLEVQHLRENSVKALRGGKDLTSAVQETLKVWQKTRAEIDACTQKTVAEKPSAKSRIDWKRVSTSAISSVLGGSQVQMAVNSALRQERALAAICDAALSLDGSIDDRQVKQLQGELAKQTGLDDEALLKEAKRLVSTEVEKVRSNMERVILEEIKRATQQHPLSQNEREDVVVRVTKAMAEGAALDVAVLNALPKSQTIWDTAENTAMRGDGDPKFVPFVSKQNQGTPRPLEVGAAVEIHSLQKSPELNGVRGEVVESEDLSTGRCQVKTATGRILALKPVNLRLLSAQPSVPTPAPAPAPAPTPAAPPPASQAVSTPEAEKKLREAAGDGETAEVQRLLSEGTDPNGCDSYQNAPLHIAAYKGHGSVVDQLLQGRADVNLKGEDQNAPLHEAAAGGHGSVVDQLLQARADVNLKGRSQKAPLHIAAEKGHGSVVDQLLQGRADVNLKDRSQQAPLHWAALKGHGSVVDQLLQGRADVNLKDRWEMAPLHKAAIEGHGSVVDQLLQGRADVNLKDEYQKAPLHLAAQYGHGSVVDQLLQGRADVNLKDELEKAPLHIAAGMGHGSVVDQLLQGRADVNLTDRYQNAPLHRAAEFGHGSVVDQLLQGRADVNLQDQDGKTPLDWANEKGHRGVAARLLKAAGGGAKS